MVHLYWGTGIILEPKVLLIWVGESKVVSTEGQMVAAHTAAGVQG